jgi:deoxyribodipyrimidine photo-lyase
MRVNIIFKYYKLSITCCVCIEEIRMYHIVENLNIFWFRRDLRLDDNHGLYMALQNDNPVLPIFIFDKEILSGIEDKDDARVTFIYNTIKQLKYQLEKLGSSLYVLYDKPMDAFKSLIDVYKIHSVYTNHDYEPYAINRDEKVKDYLSVNNIGFFTFKDQVIFEKKEIVKFDGSPYTVFTPYSKAWKARLQLEIVPNYDTFSIKQNYYQTAPLPLLLLHELGFSESRITPIDTDFTLTRVGLYHETRDVPSIVGTSRLSVHLRFGTICIRHLVKQALHINEVWLNELIWREFYMMILYHFPHVVTSSFKPKYDNIPWRNDEQGFNAWCEGRTGYAIVDAGMQELNHTGYMHNRVRMIVASFLTKHLLIDWRLGEAYFARKLLDYDLAANNGGWQWAAGSGCDAAPYFRIFNPYVQTKKFDPQHEYINRWLPDLHELNVPPIVDHTFARNRALEIYKKALNG